MLVTHIQFPASRSRLPDVGCRSSSAPTTAVRWPSTSPSHPRHLRIVLPTEERVPAPAPRCLRGVRPASQWSAGYNTAPGGAPSEKLAAAARKCRWGVLLRAVSKHWVGNSRPALCKCRPAAQIAILACFIEMLPGLSANISTALLIMSHPPPAAARMAYQISVDLCKAGRRTRTRKPHPPASSFRHPA